ncbi:MAG: DUF6265 family protein [Ginsengibacter sp.]
MKCQYFFIVAFSFHTLIGYSQNSASKLQDLNWLLGTWRMEKKGGILIESWQQVNDSTFEETSFLLKASGEKKLLEKVQIVSRGDKLFYIPTVADQNGQQPVKFEITSFSGNEFIAENPAHDFPKRIIYKAITQDSLHARIDGGPSMPEKKSDFYYVRQNK